MIKDYILDIIRSHGGDINTDEIKRKVIADTEQCINVLCKDGEVIYVGKNINKIPILRDNAEHNLR